MPIISTALTYSPVRFGKAPANSQTENDQLNQQPALSPEKKDSIELQKNKPASKEPPYQQFLPVEPNSIRLHQSKGVHVPALEPEYLNPQMAMLLLQKLFQQSLTQQAQDGHIKLHLGAEQNMNMHSYAWLGDMLPLLGKPIDVIMESSFEKNRFNGTIECPQNRGTGLYDA